MSLFDTMKIKSSQKKFTYEDLSRWFNEDNEKTIRQTILFQKPRVQANSPYTCVEAARYCLYIAGLGEGDVPAPFYLLTWSENERGEIIKSAHNVTDNSAELVSCLKHGCHHDDKSKEYYKAVASVMNRINHESKNKTIIGYTVECLIAGLPHFELLEKYQTFAYTQELTSEEHFRVWDKVRTTSDRDRIMRIIWGEKWTKSPDRIRDAITKHNWSNLAYEVFWYQSKNFDKPIDSYVAKMVTQFEQKLENPLDYGRNLKGIDFSSSIQLETIWYALHLGDEYLDELRNDDGWISEKEMQPKYYKYKRMLKESGRL